MKTLVFILCLVLLSSLSLFAQNEENCSKSTIEGDEIILTPNLAGRNIKKEDLIIDTSKEVPAKILTDFDEILEIKSDNHLIKKDSEPYYSTRDDWNSQIPIWTGPYNQKAPNLACDNDGIIYCAFENYDNSHPYTYISIEYTTNGGSSWEHFWGFYSNTSDFLLPSIVYANGYIFISIIVDSPTYGKYVNVVRKSLVSVDFQSFLPPTPGSDDIQRARLCSDSESYEGNAYLMLAYVYGNVNNDDLEIYYTLSTDDAENWIYYGYIDDVYKSYWTWDVGIDWGDCGIFISYLGTGSYQNKLMAVKSTNYGSSWSNPEVIYDNDHNKLGPIVAVHNDNILVVFQYEFDDNPVDNDIKGTRSTDCGLSWETHYIAPSSEHNEELPWVAHDNAGNFYVTYWKGTETTGGEIYAEFGDDPNVGNPVQINATSIASEDDYTTVIGKTIYNTNSDGAVAAWVDDPWGDLNIWGNYYPEVGATDDWVIDVSSSNLYQNFPNPFNPETTIEYNLNENSNVQIEIFNTKGQKVKTLIDDFRDAGYHQAIWNGTDNQNKPVSSGLYFYRLKSNSFSQIRKMIMLK